MPVSDVNTRGATNLRRPEKCLLLLQSAIIDVAVSAVRQMTKSASVVTNTRPLMVLAPASTRMSLCGRSWWPAALLFDVGFDPLSRRRALAFRCRIAEQLKQSSYCYLSSARHTAATMMATESYPA